MALCYSGPRELTCYLWASPHSVPETELSIWPFLPLNASMFSIHLLLLFPLLSQHSCHIISLSPDVYLLSSPRAFLPNQAPAQIAVLYHIIHNPFQSVSVFYLDHHHITALNLSLVPTAEGDPKKKKGECRKRLLWVEL